MDPESKELLKATYKLVEENNSMIKKMYRHQRLSSLFRILYWVIVFGIGIGLFYYLQPYVDQFKGFVSDTTTTLNNFKSTFQKK